MEVNAFQIFYYLENEKVNQNFNRNWHTLNLWNWVYSLVTK